MSQEGGNGANYKGEISLRLACLYENAKATSCHNSRPRVSPLSNCPAAYIQQGEINPVDSIRRCKVASCIQEFYRKFRKYVPLYRFYFSKKFPNDKHGNDNSNFNLNT